MAKTNSFSLYLAKQSVTDFDDLLTDAARGLLASPNGRRITTKGIGDDAVLFIFPGRNSTPKWVPLLQSHFAQMPNVFTRSPCALVAFKKDDAIFALSFSYAHTYLDEAKTEAEFGLRVAINSVNDEKLRSIERTNIGAAIRDFAQSAGLNNLRSFGLEETLDLIRKVSGHTEDSDFAEKVAGARSLRFSADIDLPGVPEAAIETLKLFKSQAYKKTAFRIIDQLSPVLDPSLASELDSALLASIHDGEDDFEIAIPGILPPDSVGSFRFENAGINGWFVDLSLELYQQSLGNRLPDLRVEDLKKHKVAAYADDNERPLERWSIHHALVGSTLYDGNRYALNEGSWYKISNKLRDDAERRFSDLCGAADKTLGTLTQYHQRGSSTRKRASYESERSYNKGVAKATGYLMMDGKLIRSEETPSGFEACDLLDIQGRRFIHVKKSSRRSSVLSHFFKQGGHAANLVRRDHSFKSALIDRVKSDYGGQTSKNLRGALDSADRWTVDFEIADFPRANGKFNIPFFSKLTLQDETRKIEYLNFAVRLGFVKLSRIKRKPK